MSTEPLITSGWSRLRNLIKKSLAPIMNGKERNTAPDPILSQILYDRRIDMVFQPIVTLDNYEVLGYEALARGPQGSIYEEPLKLLSAADSSNCRLEMEAICHQSAISAASEDLQDKCLFLNINPPLVNCDYYCSSRMLTLLHNYSINPEQIVLELTERTKIDDYALLRNNLDYFRSYGIRVAIDDAGAGYSSLQAIAELQPDFVKMDLSLIRHVDKNPVKLAILETLSNLCMKIKSSVICEGIEDVEELQVLRKIGCEYGQGFLFSTPGHINPNPNISGNMELVAINKDESVT